MDTLTCRETSLWKLWIVQRKCKTSVPLPKASENKELRRLSWGCLDKNTSLTWLVHREFVFCNMIYKKMILQSFMVTKLWEKAQSTFNHQLRDPFIVWRTDEDRNTSRSDHSNRMCSTKCAWGRTFLTVFPAVCSSRVYIPRTQTSPDNNNNNNNNLEKTDS